MNLCNYYDRLEIENGELVRVVNAVPRATKKSHLSLDVYKEYESSKSQCRNLYTTMCGYRVAFPDEVVSLYRNNCEYIQKLDDWADVDKLNAFYGYSGGLDEKSRELILGKYPDFIYVLNKWSGSIAKVMDVLVVWKSHKEVEMMLAVGYERLVLNKSFWRLSEPKRKEVVSYIRNNKPSKNMSLADIQTVLKYRLSDDEFRDYEQFAIRCTKIKYDIYRYLKKIGKLDYQGVSLYRDYQKLLKQTPHNKNDNYWKYPKDLQFAHDRVLEEVENIKIMSQMEKLKLKQNDYSKAVKKLLKFRKDIDGYCVFVPDTVDEIQRQAKSLHQCLISADYVSQVISRNCVLVFIQKDGEPVATCQLLSGDRIGQFYANELDRSNCLPTDEVRAVMNKWIDYKRSAA